MAKEANTPKKPRASKKKSPAVMKAATEPSPAPAAVNDQITDSVTTKPPMTLWQKIKDYIIG